MYHFNSKKAIVYFTPSWPPGDHPNGVVSYIGNISKGLISQGNTVHVVTGNNTGSTYENIKCSDVNNQHVNIIRLLGEKLNHKVTLFSKYWIPLFTLRIVDEIKRLNSIHACDIFEIEESFGIAKFIKFFVNVPIVVRLHGPWFLNGSALGVTEDSSFKHRVAAEGKAILSADGVTSPSFDVLNAVRRRYNIPLSNAAVIPNPVPVIPEEKRWSLANSDKKTILFIGRFDRHKGGDIVIDSFNKIAQVCPESKLVFIGPDRGLFTDTGANFNLQKYIENHTLPDVRSRIVIKGSLNYSEIEPLRRSAHVTIMASRYENFSMALLESLSFGCPTVATDVGGNPEILLDEKTGLLCKTNDPESLANKVIELLRNPQKSAELGHAASQDMKLRFSPEVITRKTLEYYESIWARKEKNGKN